MIFSGGELQTLFHVMVMSALMKTILASITTLSDPVCDHQGVCVTPVMRVDSLPCSVNSTLPCINDIGHDR